MNCFEWQNRASDYLDQSLSGTQLKDAQVHLASCESCVDRHKHYQEILTSIGSQRRVSLPEAVRKAPFSALLARPDAHSRKYRWERTPWFIRTSVEGLGVAFIILFVVAMVPRIRTWYEQSVERRLDAFDIAELEHEASDPGKDAAPLVRGKLADSGALPADGEEAEEGDDFSEDVEPEDTRESERQAAANGKAVRVGNSEIWRFHLKTDSPRELRAKVVALLMEQNLPANTPGIGGIEAPGGIHFDLVVPQSMVANLKLQLQKIAGAPAPSLASRSDAPLKDPFTWYKNKSRRKIPAGKSRVVIWLSQL